MSEKIKLLSIELPNYVEELEYNEMWFKGLSQLPQFRYTLKDYVNGYVIQIKDETETYIEIEVAKVVQRGPLLKFVMPEERIHINIEDLTPEEYRELINELMDFFENLVKIESL